MKTFIAFAPLAAALTATNAHADELSLRQTSNFIEEGAGFAVAPAKKPKYYFRIPLPLGRFNLDDVLPMVKEGHILELVETRVSEQFDKLGLSDLRFGWDGRLNPSEASTDAGVLRLKSLFAEQGFMTLQFNVQGTFKPDANPDHVKNAIETIQTDNKLTDTLADALDAIALKMGLSKSNDKSCSAPWTGDQCAEFDAAGMTALRAAVNELATFEGEHHSDFTIALLGHMDGLERELESELSTIAAASGRTSQVAETCCNIWQAADGITSKFRFQVTSLKRTMTEDMNLEKESACGLPHPHTAPASGTNVGDMETPLLSTMTTMHSRIQSWSKYMAGSHFANMLTDKMNVVKYDLEALVHQSLIVLYNHDFVQERCGNLAQSLSGLVGENHFTEFHKMLRVPRVGAEHQTIQADSGSKIETSPKKPMSLRKSSDMSAFDENVVSDLFEEAQKEIDSESQLKKEGDRFEFVNSF